MTSKIIAFILGLVVLVCVYFLWKDGNNYDGLIKISKQVADTAKYWKDQYGNEHATLEQVQLSAAAAALVYGKELDSLSKLLKVSAKDIKEFTTYKEGVAINVKPQKVDTQYYPRDTGKMAANDPQRIRRLAGLFVDPWLNARVTLGDSNSIKAMVTDTTGYVRYVKGFFNPKSYIDITHRAPYINSTDIKSFEVQDAASRIEVVLMGGIGYSTSGINLKSPVGIFGLGVGYRLFSIGKK